MSVPRLELLGLLSVLSGCIPDTGPPFTRLVSALGDTTADVGGPPITASLLVAGIGADSCVRQDDHPWRVSVGDPAPLPDDLLLALGSPTVSKVSVADDGSVEATLDGARIFGHADSKLTLEIASGVSDYTLQARALAGDSGAEIGRESVTVRQGCAAEESYLKASATWTEDDGSAHTVAMPATDGEGYGLHLGAAAPYLPTGGTVAWKGAINGVEHSLLGDDAAGLSMDSPPEDGPLPSAWWPATASGASWDAAVLIPVAP